MNRRFLAAVPFLLATSAVVRPAQETPSARTPEPTTALLVVDIQNFYFEGGRVPLEHPVDASLKARTAIERFRALSWPVIHVQHLPAGTDTPDPDIAEVAYRIHPNVKPLSGERVVGKHHANAFRDTGLLALLRGLGVTRVVICGMQTHMCVEAAARAAADLGFDVVILHDACATRDLTFGGVTVSATQVHVATLAALSGSYGTILATDGFLAALPAPTVP